MDIASRLDEAMRGARLSQSALARTSGVSQPTINRILKGNGKSGPETDTITKLAAACGVNFSWMHEGIGPKSRGGAMGAKGAPQDWPAERAVEPDDVTIPQYDGGGSMGNGLVLDGLAGVIKSWRVDLEWLRMNVRSHTGIHNLCIVTGFGPSMKPMFNPGDPLLIDKGITSFESGDAIYFFRIGDRGFIKTVQRIPTPEGGIIYRAKSKNPDYDPFDMVKGMDFEVFGRVLTVWKSEQF